MRPFLPTLLKIILLVQFSPVVAAVELQDTQHHQVDAPEDAEDDEPIQRVARLSFVDGDVSFLRAGVTEWADAVENLPLLTGDQLYTGRGARAEIQLGRGNYIRLSEHTALTIADLSHTAAQFEVTEGIAMIRLERFGSAFERFEIDTPNAALMLQQDGIYRVDVSSAEQSEVIVRRGSAEVSTTDGNFRLQEGQRLSIDTSAGGRLEIALDNTRDDWDRWSYERDQTADRVVTALSPDYVNTHETSFNSFYGASELASYGSWTSVSSYGYCWIPRVAAGWAPYRFGQWLWIPRGGWTWLSREPWGWAPYHYGRWALLPGLGWAWVPGIYSPYYRYRHSYYQWRPALVSFFHCPTARGSYVGWYPLRPGERWRRPDHHSRPGDHRHLQYPGPRDARRRLDAGQQVAWRADRREGVTVLPVEGFNRPGRSRPQVPDRELGPVLGKGVREGLPEITPDRDAAAPGWRRAGDESRPRPVAAPPPDIISRPVVTRNRPADSEAETSVPRERRLVAPRKFRDLGENPIPSPRFGDTSRSLGSQAPRGDRSDRRDDESQGSPPRHRQPRNATPEASSDDSGSRERMTGPGRPDWRRRPDPSPQGEPDNSDRSPRRASPRPPADNNSSSGSTSNEEDRRREKQRAERWRPVEDEKPTPHFDAPQRRRDSERTPERNAEPRAPSPPRQEVHNNSRNEQRQERREERREQREQRKGRQP